jgi:hypothetical protein
MKDAVHHLKHTQRKVVQSARKETTVQVRNNHIPNNKQNSESLRPKA